MGTYYRFYCDKCNKFCKTEIKTCLRSHNMEAIREFIDMHYYACSTPKFYMVDEEVCSGDWDNEDIGDTDEKPKTN